MFVEVYNLEYKYTSTYLMHDVNFFVDQKLKSQKMAKIDCHIDIQSID